MVQICLDKPGSIQTALAGYPYGLSVQFIQKNLYKRLPLNMSRDNDPARTATEAIVIALGFRGCSIARDWAATCSSLKDAYETLRGSWFPALLLRIGYNPADVLAVVEPALQKMPAWSYSGFWNVFSIQEQIIRTRLPQDMVASVYRANFPFDEVLSRVQDTLSQGA